MVTPKVIAMFNHKGGVSKTTSTFNIGWELASRGKKVLLVDGDPQCNLTGLILGDAFEDYYDNENTRTNNLYDGVKPAFDGVPKPISAIECVKTNNENLYLLPGHMNLSELETQLSFALLQNQQLSTLQNLPGSFYQLIVKCSERYNFDVVIIDMNPGLGAINQTLFMTANGFIIPTNPDPFSVMAIKTMTKVVPRWNMLAKSFNEQFRDAAYSLPESNHVFLGTLIQQFNTRNEKPASVYKPRIEEVKQSVSNVLVPVLEKKEMTLESYPDTLINNQYTLAEIRNFDALLKYSVDKKVPVFALSSVEIGLSGSALSTIVRKRDDIKQTFKELGDYLITELEQL